METEKLNGHEIHSLIGLKKTYVLLQTTTIHEMQENSNSCLQSTKLSCQFTFGPCFG